MSRIEFFRENASVVPPDALNAYGSAGTSVLFNVSALHTATVRVTRAERKSVQVHYGHPSRPYLSNDSVLPATFWRDSADTSVRRLYLAAFDG